MRYFVVWPDGQRFGPADIPLLQQWARENRIGPATVLIEESTGQQVQAANLGMISFLPQATSTSPLPPQDPSAMQSPYSGYYARPSAPLAGRGSEVVLAWVFGALGLVCCQLFSIAGIVLAAVGLNKRQPGALAALIFCIVVTVIGFALGALFSIGDISGGL